MRNMEIEIVSRKENMLIERTEIVFKTIHLNEKTPKRTEIKEKLAELLGVSKGNVVIDNMKAEFGRPESMGYAKVYKNMENGKGLERDYILRRNNLLEKKAEKPAEKKPVEVEKKEEEEGKKKEKEKAEGKKMIEKTEEKGKKRKEVEKKEKTEKELLKKTGEKKKEETKEKTEKKEGEKNGEKKKPKEIKKSDKKEEAQKKKIKR